MKEVEDVLDSGLVSGPEGDLSLWNNGTGVLLVRRVSVAAVPMRTKSEQ